MTSNSRTNTTSNIRSRAEPSVVEPPSGESIAATKDLVRRLLQVPKHEIEELRKQERKEA
jgi:hypothetical protein